MKPLDEVTKAYWAGIIDGEGYLKLQDRRAGKSPRLTLKMTCEETVKQFAETFDLTWKKRNRTASIKDHYKDQYICSVEGQKVAYICILLMPYMITKRSAANVIIEHYKRKCPMCECTFWSKGGMIYCGEHCANMGYNWQRREKRKKGPYLKAPSVDTNV